MSIPELLVNERFITPEDRKRIENLSADTGQSFIKVALNFGYISRKNYERILINYDYKIEQIRTEAFDTEIIRTIDLRIADEKIALQLR
ncbi:MAG: glycosyltransferase family 2 protein, partial [Mucilaginibacter sp.]